MLKLYAGIAILRNVSVLIPMIYWTSFHSCYVSGSNIYISSKNSKLHLNSHYEFGNICIRILTGILQFVPLFNLGSRIFSTKTDTNLLHKHDKYEHFFSWKQAFNHKLAPHLLNTYLEKLSTQPHKIWK